MNKRNLIIIGILSVLAVFLIGFLPRVGSFTSGERNESANEVSGVQLVGPTEFSRLIENNDAFLVDVHIPEQTHIPGTDVLIPYNEISENLNQLPKDKSTPILVYCRSGSMSRQASQEIYDLGYTNVYDLDGGVNAYKASGVDEKVAITPDNQDLGTVIYGDVPTTEFVFTNYTSLPLDIIRVSTSCGCTTAEVEEKKLGPYESTKVKVSFNPAVHGDATDLGELTRTIYIATDNPNFPKFENTITAKVVKENL